MSKLLEKDIQKQIIDYLNWRNYDLYFFRSGSGAIKTADGRYFKTGKKGCPDITVLFRGRFIAIEVKGDKGKQSPEQIETEKLITRFGGIYVVVRSLDEVMSLLTDVGLSKYNKFL